MRKLNDVQIGEIKVKKGNSILRSTAIGSCIVIVAYDASKAIGAMAHVMLPGTAPPGKKSNDRTKYAADAIDAILERMTGMSSKGKDIEVILVGGANVLKRKDDRIAEENVGSVVKLLSKRHLKVTARSLGGTQRRSISLDVGRGIVLCEEGDFRKKLLRKAGKAIKKDTVVSSK